MFKRGVRNQLAWVDNFWQFHPDPASAMDEAKLADSTFADLGLTLHEQAWVSKSFKGQGWHWDSGLTAGRWPQTMTCPLDKYRCYIRLTAE